MDNTRMLDLLMEYELGEISDEDTVELFQYLVDSGLVNSLQGHFGRTAEHLVQLGAILPYPRPAPEDWDMPNNEADADTLKSAGWGTDEDYGFMGDREEV